MAKRKREESSERLTFGTSPTSYAPGTNVPLLLSFPAVEPPQDTAFKCYAQKKSKMAKPSEKDKDDTGPSSAGMLVVGETDDMEFFSNESENHEVEQSGCRYMIAVHNKRTSTLNLLPTSVPVHIMKQRVKALKSLKATPAPTALAYQDAKNALGESFGTKKAKANIRAQERNKVDVSAMENAMEYVMDGIEKGAEGLPTQEAAKDSANANRLIPPYNDQTTDLSEVYPLHGIIPETEWKAISVSAFEQAENIKDRQALFPARNSSWIYWHLKNMQGASIKGAKKKLKLIYYVSVLIAFRRAVGRREVDRSKVQDHLKNVPDVIIEGLLSRFTESTRGSTDHQVTSAAQTKLLTYLFALCLKADGFASDPSLLSKDLGMGLSEVNQLFKSLGCTLKKLTDKERSQHGYSNDTSDTKMAVLTAPVKFPKPMRKKGRR